MNGKQVRFVFINGRGSSGKDTQADFLEEDLKGVRISTGNIYRAARIPGDRFHEEIKPYIEHVDNGGYVPDEVMLPIVDRVIAEYLAEGISTFIFTGFPRTSEQFLALELYLFKLEEEGFEVRDEFISFEVSEEISRDRAKCRRERALAVGGEVRADDDPATVERRLDSFVHLTEPMLEMIRALDRLIVIDASGTIEEVRRETRRILGIEGRREIERE